MVPLNHSAVLFAAWFCCCGSRHSAWCSQTHSRHVVLSACVCLLIFGCDLVLLPFPLDSCQVLQDMSGYRHTHSWTASLTALCCWVPQVQPTAKNARNHSQCDSMLIGDSAGANTYPYIQARVVVPPFLAVCIDLGRRVHMGVLKHLTALLRQATWHAVVETYAWPQQHAADCQGETQLLAICVLRWKLCALPPLERLDQDARWSAVLTCGATWVSARCIARNLLGQHQQSQRKQAVSTPQRCGCRLYLLHACVTIMQ